MISFENVYKRYKADDDYVFQGFSEYIEEGEFIILTGKSGSGKSTLIRMLLKETEPDLGTITVNGRDLSAIADKDIPFYRRGIGVIFQDFRLFDEYTVYGNLELTLSLTVGRGKETEQRITNILKLLNIDRLFKRYPKELSGGEKQKVCMARALINDPMVLLADEPAGNLDPKSSEEIVKLLELVHRHGTTVVMATHDYDTAASIVSDGRRISLDH
ncbi:MAG: ATP-binding cassette domain-containing protein [Lachnospiraceae bacterium]|nr:ATP-binding cassette domain-containing protein [Lachnospiraceae bacterium]